jgi:hypothetical protein
VVVIVVDCLRAALGPGINFAVACLYGGIAVAHRRVTSTPTPPPPAALNLRATTPYTQPNRRFSIDYPQGWDTFEQPNGVVILEPTGQMGYSVFFRDVDRPYSQDELRQYLMGFIAQNFAGDGRDFRAISQKLRADGAIDAEFSTQDPKLGQTLNRIHGRQSGNTIFLLYTTAAAARWPDVQGQLQQLVDTFAPLEPPVAAAEAPEWQLIGPTSQEFGFLVSSDWEVVEQGVATVTVKSPSGGMTFTAANFPWPGAQSNPTAAAREAALQHIETVRAGNRQVQALPPVEFPLAGAVGATIDFVYTTPAGQSMAGSVITGAGQGKMHKIIFTAPTDFYEAGLVWFNPMYQSFKFLAPAAGLPKEP